jgi:type I restriction enzyme M protein
MLPVTSIPPKLTPVRGVDVANPSQQIVQKLLSYGNILRDDGLSYPDYVEQITYLLFLKMVDEKENISSRDSSILSKEYSWRSLVSGGGVDLQIQYSRILGRLAGGTGIVGVIFHQAENKIQDPAKLELLVLDIIDKEKWSTLDSNVMGEVYEGLLERYAQDAKSGAGQYFTPRSLINAIVQCVRPQPGETIFDPACETGGFLLAAHKFILDTNPDLTKKQAQHLQLRAIRGVESAPTVARLAAMNFLLHGIGPLENEGKSPIVTADSLTADAGGRYDVILTNPPFGKKSGATIFNEAGERKSQSIRIVRDDFLVVTSNKQLNFLQLIRTALNETGRAAVVVPDNVLFEGGAGEIIRRRLFEDYDVHTLLRLPPGIFYAQGVRTSVVFFDSQPPADKPITKELWVYDLRTNMHFTLRNKRLESSDLEEFVECYNASSRQSRKATWSKRTPHGRWRVFTYDELAERDKFNLDIFWIEDDSLNGCDALPAPTKITPEITDDLRNALAQLEEIRSDFPGR